ncbi:MAG: hypothetical protein J6U14_07705 [Bacteroidaceae bacterium]|nr:hypothetical protein [Bacteroidaceae bacterium]
MRGFYHIAGVRRATIYSPNSVDKDAAIFLEVLKCLESLGHQVMVYDEADLSAGVVEERYIFNMVRSQMAITQLQTLEQTGVVSINSGFGIEHCRRELMTTLLLNNNIPFAPSQIFNLVNDQWSLSGAARAERCLHQLYRDETELERSSMVNGQWSTFNGPCWVKRADGHTVEQSDVMFVSEASRLSSVLDDFAQRGIYRVVISKHLPGDLVKFYGVSGTDFFHWFYPWEAQHSKFGNEEVNGIPTGISFSVEALQEICRQATEVLGVDVYGGDAVIATNGTIRLIDFNDWPSFSPCRLEAAKAIAKAIIQKIERYDS